MKIFKKYSYSSFSGAGKIKKNRKIPPEYLVVEISNVHIFGVRGPILMVLAPKISYQNPHEAVLRGMVVFLRGRGPSTAFGGGWGRRG